MLVCTKCRSVGMPPCEHIDTDAVFYAGPKWRAPKKTNDLGWRRVTAGDILWDHNAIPKRATRDRAALEAKALGRWGTRCHNGHLIEHPNVVYSKTWHSNTRFPHCASCQRARFEVSSFLRTGKRYDVQVKELADRYYAETGLK